MQKSVCFVQNSIESLLISDINLKNPSDQEGQFIPGNSICEKTLRVALSTNGHFFPSGVVLRLQLVSSIDLNKDITKIEPRICVSKTTEYKQEKIWFDFTAAQIPLPRGYVYLPNSIDNCTSPNIGLQAGEAVKYCFLLTVQKCRLAPLSCPGIPFVANVMSNAACDIKCEKPEVRQEPDETHTLKIFCKDNKTYVYAAPVHCVTHCQAPRPIENFASPCTGLVVTENHCKTCQ